MTSTHTSPMRPALSTAGCGKWTLSHVASAAGAAGYHGVELLTHGYGATELSCDPMLSDAAKVRTTLVRHGVVPVGLATTIGFDEPIVPPVLGHVRDTERSVRRARRVIEFASAMGCPFVRVLAVDGGRAGRRAASTGVIVKRLRLVAARCRGLSVQLLVENCGPFASAGALAGLLDRVDEPKLMGVSYSVAAGQAAGDRVSEAGALLGDRLCLVRLADHTNGRPCPLGEGELGAAEALDALRDLGFDGWVVNEIDRPTESHQAQLDRAIAAGPAMILRGVGPWVVDPPRRPVAV